MDASNGAIEGAQERSAPDPGAVEGEQPLVGTEHGSGDGDAQTARAHLADGTR